MKNEQKPAQINLRQISRRLRGVLVNPVTRKPSTATVELRGKTYGLAFDANTLAEVEREAGVSLLSSLLNFQTMSLCELRGVLLAAILAHDPDSDLDITSVGDLITPDTIFMIIDSLAATFLAAMPAKTDEPMIDESKEDPAAEPVAV